MADRMPKFRDRDLPSAGFNTGADYDPGPASPQQKGSVIQRMGSRETFVWNGVQWVTQNDDLGGKLDAIAAGQEAMLNKLDETNELLGGIIAALTGSSS